MTEAIGQRLRADVNAGGQAPAPKAQRIAEVDVLKGMGILLMVAGHVGFGTTFDFLIHSFHMPMFFIISGYLFNGARPFGEFVGRKAKSLLVPYVVFGALNLLAWVVANVVLGGQGVAAIASPLFHLCWENTEGLPIAGALWFLTALFVAEVVFYAVVKAARGRWLPAVALALLCSVGGLALSSVDGVPFGIDSGLVGVGLMGVGFSLKAAGGGIPKRSRRLAVATAACLAGGICATFLNSYVNMRTGVYGNFVLFYCAAVLMTIGLYGVAVFLRPCWARNELEFIGSNSLTYVCLNQLAITLLEKLSALVPVGSSTILSVTVSVAVLVAAMVALHLCALLLNRHFKWALGKF